jgi:hypothetical protein
MALAGYMRSWIRKHRPLGWEHLFWTDRKNRLLVEARFPQYLELFDALPQNIMRADMIRYLILYEFGGVYADLDFQSLRPLDDLFAAHGHAEYHSGGGTGSSSSDRTNKSAPRPSSRGTGGRFSAMIGQEPDAHAHILYKLPSMVCNAFMISCPGHPFWLEVVDLIQDRFASGMFKNRVLKLTGPMVVQAALDLRRRGASGGGGGGEASARSPHNPVMLADPDLFYPSIDITNENLRNNCNRELLAQACALGSRANSRIMMREAEAEPATSSTGSKKTEKALSPEQCTRRELTCDALRRAHFQNRKTYPDSFADHHWSHSWLPGFEDRYHMSGYGFGGVPCMVMDVATVLGSEARYTKARRKCGYDRSSRSSSRTVDSRQYGHGSSRFTPTEGKQLGQFAWTGRADLPKFCLGDKKRLCALVKPGGGRTHDCMCEKLGDIKDMDCRAFMQKRIVAKKKKKEKEKEKEKKKKKKKKGEKEEE